RSLALRGNLELDVVVRIDINVTHIAVLKRELQLVSGSAFDILFAEQLDGVPFGFVVDQRAVDVGLLLKILQIVARYFLGIRRALERIDLPAGVTVVRLHHRFALKGNVHSHHRGSFLLEGYWDFDALLNDLAGSLDGLNGLELLNASVRVDVLLYDLIDGLGGCLNAEQNCDREKRGYGPSNHVDVLLMGKSAR